MNLSTVYRALQGLTVYRRLLDQPVTGALTALIHAAARKSMRKFYDIFSGTVKYSGCAQLFAAF